MGFGHIFPLPPVDGGLREAGVLGISVIFAAFFLAVKATPRMGSFCPICLEQNWLAMSPEGVGSACLGFLLVLSSSGPAGNAFGGSLLVGLSGACFHFLWPQPSSSSPNVQFWPLSLIRPIWPPVDHLTLQPPLGSPRDGGVCVMGK